MKTCCSHVFRAANGRTKRGLWPRAKNLRVFAGLRRGPSGAGPASRSVTRPFGARAANGPTTPGGGSPPSATVVCAANCCAMAVRCVERGTTRLWPRADLCCAALRGPSGGGASSRPGSSFSDELRSGHDVAEVVFDNLFRCAKGLQPDSPRGHSVTRVVQLASKAQRRAVTGPTDVCSCNCTCGAEVHFVQRASSRPHTRGSVCVG